MRPTFSIIAFTVLSGIGYGAWFLQGLGWLIGPVCGSAETLGDGISTIKLCMHPFDSATGLVLAFGFVALGLLASLGHLGKPLRAWRALSQWRSSWLSREGIAALLTFIPASLLLMQSMAMRLSLLAPGTAAAPLSSWSFEWLDSTRFLLGLLLAAGSLVTVFCTANIYASLTTIRAWSDRHVVPAYLLLGLHGGSILLWACTTLDGQVSPFGFHPLSAIVPCLAGIAAWLKLRYWRAIDAQPTVTTGHAIGLETLGTVRPLEAPHTEENYLTHEMGFVLARKHAAKLRRIALVAAFLVPALLAMLALALPATAAFTGWLALASALVGLFVERWLFFAEAKHAVMAFYAR